MPSAPVGRFLFERFPRRFILFMDTAPRPFVPIVVTISSSPLFVRLMCRLLSKAMWFVVLRVLGVSVFWQAIFPMFSVILSSIIGVATFNAISFPFLRCSAVNLLLMSSRSVTENSLQSTTIEEMKYPFVLQAEEFSERCGCESPGNDLLYTLTV